jgi:hypothetical protein
MYHSPSGSMIAVSHVDTFLRYANRKVSFSRYCCRMPVRRFSFRADETRVELASGSGDSTQFRFSL